MTMDGTGHYVPLAGDWALWRDFAVRSAGFPVSGLDVFGSPDESEQLARIAADPLFREALMWQNRTALTTQVDALAHAATQSGSKRRRREAVVANYWQRYCAKNDMIGFFGPLAWGRVDDSGPAVAVRSRALIAEREVHFETWCMQALARHIDPAIRAPLRLRPEREMRAQIERLGDATVRERGLFALDRLEAARAAVADAKADELVQALDAFDDVFFELTGEPAVRSDDASAGGRTPLFLDCTRDLELDLGPALVSELASSLPPFLDSSRWYCGRSYALGRRLIAEAIAAAHGPQPLESVCDDVMAALRQLPTLLQPDLQELQQRWAALLADGDASSLVQRAAAAFADHGPAWPPSVYQNPDVQIAARSIDDIVAGRFLPVEGPCHHGNALLQGMFADRHPDRQRLRADVHTDLGSPLLYVIPRRGPAVPIDARIVPNFTWPDDIHVAMGPDERAPDGYRCVRFEDVLIDGDACTDRAASFRAPVADLFWMPMFLAAMHTFDPFPVRGAHGDRITVGRTVLRRETWAAPAESIPHHADAFASWARGRGLPRRVFCRPPGEAKPMYVDLESPVLTSSLHRMLRRVAESEPGASIRFSEMLPGPDDCWLEQDGARYTCELRVVAVDLSRRGGGGIQVSQRSRSSAGR